MGLNNFSAVCPMLYTNELEATIEFYTGILGFTCSEKNTDWGWAILVRDAAEIMLAKPNEHIPFDKPNFTGSFYIQVVDADQLWNQLKEKVKICYEIEDFDWGMREFAIFDNNGYTLQFGHPISEANSQ